MPDTLLAAPRTPTAGAAAAPRRPAAGRARPAARPRAGPGDLVIAIVGQIVNPVFLQPDNLINVLQTMSEIALLVLAADASS